MQRADLLNLYASHAEHLERAVRIDVDAPDVVIEDACQFAWWRLLCLREAVSREAALVWLSRTAVHEALKLVRRDRRELSLDELLLDGLPADEATEPHELACARERIGSIAKLPRRQQRMLWLRAAGFSYSEMAASEGCTRRTVDRQLFRARARLRELISG